MTPDFVAYCGICDEYSNYTSNNQKCVVCNQLITVQPAFVELLNRVTGTQNILGEILSRMPYHA